MTCPMCSCDMPAKTLDGHTRVYCSRYCRDRGCAALTRERNACLDEMAVVRLIQGSPVASTKAERIEAVRTMTARGLSAAVIAQRLHTTRRSVWRYRAELHRKALAS